MNLYKKKKVVSWIVLPVLLILIAGGVTLLNYKSVTIIDGQNVYVVNTFKNTVQDVLEVQSIELREEDIIDRALDYKVSRKDTITINRAKSVTILADNIQNQFFTMAGTVEEAIRESGIELGEEDMVSPSLTTKLVDNTEVVINRIDNIVLKEYETINFERIVRRNENEEKGVVRELQRGRPGQKEISIKITYKDGEEIAREIIGEQVVSEAVAQIVEEGTKNFIITSRGEKRTFKTVLYMTATAYHAGYESTGKRPGDPYYGMTRSGTQVRPGVVAVDPSVIRLGSTLYVESLGNWPDYGVAFAEDTGSAIKGNKIDLYFEDYETALRFGRRQVKVYVLD